MRTVLASVLAVSAGFVLLVGCGSSADADQDDGVDKDDAEVVTAAAVGTYRIDKAPSSESITMSWIQTLALKTDHTFFAHEQALVLNANATGMDQVDQADLVGTYKLKKSKDGKRTIEISFKDSGGKSGKLNLPFKLAEGDIKLAPDLQGGESDDDFLLMKRDRLNAWCGQASDCKLQNLVQSKCPGADGEWKCAKVNVGKPVTSINACRLDVRKCGG